MKSRNDSDSRRAWQPDGDIIGNTHEDKGGNYYLTMLNNGFIFQNRKLNTINRVSICTILIGNKSDNYFAARALLMKNSAKWATGSHKNIHPPIIRALRWAVPFALRIKAGDDFPKIQHNAALVGLPTLIKELKNERKLIEHMRRINQEMLLSIIVMTLAGCKDLNIVNPGETRIDSHGYVPIRWLTNCDGVLKPTFYI